jgi:hypothetical protein
MRNKFQMRDCPQSLQDTVQQMVWEQQRIAAREDDVPDFGMLPQIGDGAIQLTLLQKARFAHQPFSGAEAAVDRTLVGHHEEDAVGVPVDQVGHRAHQVFFEGIVFCVDVVELRDLRDDLLPDGVAFFFHRSENGRGDSHGIGTDDGFDLFLVEPESVCQILWLHDALSEYPSPFLHVSILSNRLLKKSARGALASLSGLAGRPFSTACR